jgi:hypothetical protein
MAASTPGTDQVGQLVLQGAFLPTVALIIIKAVHVALAQSNPQLFEFVWGLR